MGLGNTGYILFSFLASFVFLSIAACLLRKFRLTRRIPLLQAVQESALNRALDRQDILETVPR